MGQKAHFEVFALPIGKGRPKFGRVKTKSGKEFTTAHTPEKTVEFENLIRVEYRTQCPDTYLHGQLSADIVAFFPIPKSTSKKKAAEMLAGSILHTKRPDGDNIVKAILDALNSTAYDDDSAVAVLRVEKRYGDRPKVIIDIEEI